VNGLAVKNGGTKFFDGVFTDMHSSEQAGVLFIMELYGDIIITTTTLIINKSTGIQS
jgi:hypothetical protein